MSAQSGRYEDENRFQPSACSTSIGRQDERTAMTVAYVDESIRMTAVPPTYLMAAVIPMSNDQLAAFESLFQRGARKLHWRDMPAVLRKKSVRAIANMEHLTTIVTAAPLDGKKQERARAKCLAALLLALEGLGISVAVIESRNDRKADLRDIETAERLRSSGAISSIRVNHAGPEERMLWLPDQVLGAYGTALCGIAEAESWMDDWAEAKRSIDVINIDL